MRRLFLIATLAAAAPAQGQPNPPFARVDSLLRAACPATGCALVVMKDGRVLYRRGVGGIAPDEAVPIASATKWLSGAVLMALGDAGRVPLDERAARYLPALTGAKAAITFRQLFSHTSGFPGNDGGCLSSDTVTLRQCADALAALALVAAPGAELNYGGNSMQIAGAALEVAAGAPWDTLFARHVARPLGLARTFYGDLRSGTPTANPRIAGGAWSSADDYARFLTMLLARGSHGGRRVLSEAAVETMHRDQTGSATIGFTPYSAYVDLDPALPLTRYGVGNWTERIGAGGRALENSSQGAFGFSPWVDFERGYAGVLSVRSTLRNVMPLYLALKPLVRTAVAASTALAPTPAPAGIHLTLSPSPGRSTRATIRLDVPTPVRLLLLDVLGRTRAVLHDGPLGAGAHPFSASAAGLAAGVYFIHLTTPAARLTRAFVVP